jgi:L-threonylcarbamoyladenylate synthase
MNLEPVFALATDTLWGLACRADDYDSVQKIFQLKGRQFDQPLTLFVADHQAAGKIQHIPQDLIPWLEHHWPGPLTFISRSVSRAYQHCHPSSERIGIRIPRHEGTLDLLRELSIPLAVTSFNLSGQKPAKTRTELLQLFSGQVTQIVGNMCSHSIESSVITLDGTDLRILRGTRVQTQELKLSLPHPYKILP